MVTFHSPFRVGAAYARDGVDAALDRHDPLPPDHLKGLMRAAAEELLGPGSGLLRSVFGSARSATPWAWSSAQPDEQGWIFGFRHRVQIDAASRSARKDHLVLGEQAWARQARFEVRRVGAVDENDLADHVMILRCAASAVHGVGSWRRRGLGWVGIAPDGAAVSAAEVAALLSLTGGRE